MALKFFWRCEGTTLDATHDFSGGDTSATANNSPAISATGAKVGTNGLVFDGTSERYQFDSSTGIISPTLGSLGFWLRMDTWAVDQVVLNVRGSTGGNNSFSVDLTSLVTGALRFNIQSTAGASTNIQTSGDAHVEDTWYFVILRWNEAGSIARIETYTESGGTLTLHASAQDADGFSPPVDLAASDGFRIGDGSGSGGVFHIDNIFIADTYAEALESNALITSYTAYGGGGVSAAARFAAYYRMMNNNN